MVVKSTQGVEGGSLLYFYKLNTPDAPVTNAASKCCETLMFLRCPYYHYNAVAVPAPETQTASGAWCAGGKLSDYDENSLPLPYFISFRQGRERYLRTSRILPLFPRYG